PRWKVVLAHWQQVQEWLRSSLHFTISFRQEITLYPRVLCTEEPIINSKFLLKDLVLKRVLPKGIRQRRSRVSSTKRQRRFSLKPSETRVLTFPISKRSLLLRASTISRSSWTTRLEQQDICSDLLNTAQTSSYSPQQNGSVATVRLSVVLSSTEVTTTGVTASIRSSRNPVKVITD